MVYAAFTVLYEHNSCHKMRFSAMIFFACLFRRLWCFEMKVEKMEAKGQEQICYSIRSPECKSATLTISGRAAILVGELNA